MSFDKEFFSMKKAFGFSLVRLGNILASLMIGEITYFATNSLAVSAAMISVGVALRTAISAAAGLLMGTVIDRTRTRFGKARPYTLVAIPMWLSLLACFAVPSGLFSGLSVNSRNIALVVYITVFSTLESAVFSNLHGIAYETHLKRAVIKEENRIKTLTIVGVVYAVGSLAMQMVLPMIIQFFQGSQKGFFLLAVVTAVYGIAACICAFFLCPEYSMEELAKYGGYSAEKKEEKIPFKDFLKSVIQNKYLIMYTCISFLYMIVMMSSFTVGQYYFQYVYGDLGIFSLVMAMSVILMPVYLFIPRLCKRFGVANVIRFTMVIACLGVILRILVPSFLVVQCIGYLCVSLPNIFVACVGSQINYECMEYGQYKTGVLAESLYSAFINFANTLSTSVSSIVIGVVLSVTGFDALTEAVNKNDFTQWNELAQLGAKGFEQYVAGGTVTVERAMGGIEFLYNWIPLLFLIICIIIFGFFHLEHDLKKERESRNS